MILKRARERFKIPLPGFWRRKSMKFFRTEDALNFHYGTILGLTEKQAKPRLMINTLKSLKDGKFEVIGAVQFKAGEVIGLEDKDIPKAFIPKLKAIEETKPASKEDIGLDISESQSGNQKSVPKGSKAEKNK
jgi:hypothetical protein